MAKIIDFNLAKMRLMCDRGSASTSPKPTGISLANSALESAFVKADSAITVLG